MFVYTSVHSPTSPSLPSHPSPAFIALFFSRHMEFKTNLKARGVPTQYKLVLISTSLGIFQSNHTSVQAGIIDTF